MLKIVTWEGQWSEDGYDVLGVIDENMDITAELKNRGYTYRYTFEAAETWINTSSGGRIKIRPYMLNSIDFEFI